MDITQLQAVLTARDEATPIVQSFLNLLRQARDATSGYGAATTSGLNSTTPAWQAQFEASQRVIAGLTAIPPAAQTAAQSITGIGQAATATTGQVAPLTAALSNVGSVAQTAGRAAAASIQSVGQAAQTSTAQINQMVQGLAAASAARAETEARIARQSVQQFGQGTLPTGSGFQSRTPTGNSFGTTAEDMRALNAEAARAATAATAIVTGWRSASASTDELGRASRTTAQSLGALGISSSQNTTAAQRLASATATTSAATQQATAAVERHSEAWVSLGGIMSHLPGPMGAVGAAFGTIHEKISQTDASLLALSATATVIGASMLGVLGASVEQAVTFERTFADVEAVTNATGAEMDLFKEKALALGVTTQFSSQKVAEGFYELSSAGLNVKEAIDAMEPSILMATLGHMELNTSTLTLATTMRQFGLEASDMGRIVDVMARIAQDSTLHWREMSQVFRNVQGSAKFMNVTIEETGAALEVMANAGTTAAMSGTAFRTFLDRIAKGTGEAGVAISRLNLQIYDQQGAFVGLSPLMHQIENATAGMTDKQKDGTIAMLGGARANALIRDALNARKEVEQDGQRVTLRGVEVLDYFIERNNSAAGTSQRAFEIISQTTKFRMDVFNASIQEAAIRIGNQLLPALNQIIPAGTNAINAFVNGGPGLQAAAAGFLAVGGAATMVSGVVGTLSIVLPLLTVALGVTGGVLLAVAAGLVAVSVAGAALAAAWVTDWNNIREHTADAGAVITTATTETVGTLTILGNYLDKVLIPSWERYLGLAAQQPPAPAPLPGLTPQPGPTDTGANESDVALYEGLGARSAENWSRGYIATITEDANGEKIAGIVLPDASALNQQGVIAGGAMGTGFSAEFSTVVEQGSADAFGNQNSLWRQALRQMELDTYAAKGDQQLAMENLILSDQNRNALVKGFQDLAPDIANDFRGRFGAAMSAGLLTPATIDEMTGELGTRLTERFGEQSEAAVSTFSQRLLEQAYKETAARDAGLYFGKQIAGGIIDTSGEIGLAMEEALLASKGSYQKAIATVLSGPVPNLAAATGLRQEEMENKAVDEAIKDLTADRWAEVKAIQEHDGALAALNHLLGSGLITTENYDRAIEGLALKHEKAKTAAQTHKAQIQEWLSSTNAATVANGLYAENLDKTITKYSHLIPAAEASARAFINAGDEMQAASVVANALGVDLQTVTDAANGNQAAIDALDRAYANATGTHKALATVAKETKQALDELSKSTDPAKVAISLLDKEYSTFATSTMAKLPIAIRAQVQALLNANDSMGAAAVAANNWGRSIEDVRLILDGNAAATAQWTAALKGETIPAMNSYAQAAYDLNPNLERAKDAGARFGLGVEKATDIVTRATAIQKEWQAALKEDEAAGRDTANSMTKLRDSFAQAAEEIKRAADKAQESAHGFRQVGGYIQDGVRVGFQDFASGELWQRVNGGLQALHDKARDSLGAHSPSQVWADDVGRPMAEGVAAGWSAGFGMVQTAVQGSLDVMVDTVGVYAGRAASAFQAAWVRTDLGDNMSTALAGNMGAANQRAAQEFWRVREGGFPRADMGIGSVESAKNRDAFLAEQKDYAERLFGTRDLDKANQMYQAQNPQAIYSNLLEKSAGSLLQSLMSSLPLARQAQLQAQASGGNVLGTLTNFWTGAGGTLTSLSDKLNNIQTPEQLNPLLGPAANAILAGSSGAGGAAGGSGSLSMTGGSGFAKAPISFASGNQFLASGARSGLFADPGFYESQANEARQAFASLAADIPQVSLSWSSIKDWSKQAENSISKVAGAFAAMPAGGFPDAASAIAAVTAAGYKTPGLGNPAVNTGGSRAFIGSGNTAGGVAYGAEQALMAQLIAGGADPSQGNFQALLAQKRRTDTEYIRATGGVTETLGSLDQEINTASNEVNNWAGIVANQTSPGAAAFNGAQDRATAAMNLLASLTAQRAGLLGSAPTGGGLSPGQVDPLSQGQPMPTEGGPWVVGPYGQGWVKLPPQYQFTNPTTVTSGAPSTTVTAPTQTTTTATTTTGPKLVASSGTEDIYRMEDGTLKRFPKGAGPSGSTGATTTTTPQIAFPSAPSPLPVATSADAGTTGASIAVTVPVTVNGTADAQNIGQQFAAVILEAVVEEGKRQGYDITQAG